MRRLGLMPWLLGWAVLTALQVGAVAMALPNVMGPQGLLSPLLAALAVVVLQGLKWPITVGRLLDLGRPPEDAVLLMAPILSTGLTIGLLKGTPSDKARKRSMRAWEGRTLAVSAWLKGLRALLAAPLITLPAVLAAGGFAAFVELVALPGFRGLTDRPPLGPGQIVGPPSDTQLAVFQGALVVVAVCGLWLVLQLFKRKKASRASWLPTLIIPAGLLIVVALWPGFAEMFGPEPAPPGFFGAGLGLFWWIFGGGVLGTLFIALGHDLREHGSVHIGRALAVWRPRFLGALAVHGGTVTVIFIGLQVLWVPGVVYAIFMGFAVHLALLAPELKPFAESQRLTRGWWRPVFAMLILGVVPAIGLQPVILVLVDFIQLQLGYGSDFVTEDGAYSPARLFAAWLTVQAMPSTISFPAIGTAIGAAVSAVFMGATQAGLVWTFHERVAQKEKRTRKAAEALGGNKPDEGVWSPPAESAD